MNIEIEWVETENGLIGKDNEGNFFLKGLNSSNYICKLNDGREGEGISPDDAFYSAKWLNNQKYIKEYHPNNKILRNKQSFSVFLINQVKNYFSSK